MNKKKLTTRGRQKYNKDNANVTIQPQAYPGLPIDIVARNANNEPVGFFKVCFEGKEGEDAWIYYMHINKQSRKCGIATAILNNLKKGCQTISTHYSASSPESLVWLRKRGFGASPSEPDRLIWKSTRTPSLILQPKQSSVVLRP